MTNAEKRFKDLEKKYKDIELTIVHKPDKNYFIADTDNYDIDHTYVYEKIEDLDRTIDTLERHLENFTKFKNIENQIKEINNNWYVDSFIDGDEICLKIKEINKDYNISMNINFILNDNTFDLSAWIIYKLTEFSHNSFNNKLKVTNNNIQFDVKNELGTEREEYYNDSYYS